MIQNIKTKINKPLSIFFINCENYKSLGLLSTSVIKLISNLNNTALIIIFNASSVTVSGKKFQNKLYKKPTNRPGNIKTQKLHYLLNLNRSPYVIEQAIKGMLPKNNIGRQNYKKVFVYSKLPIFC